MFSMKNAHMVNNSGLARVVGGAHPTPVVWAHHSNQHLPRRVGIAHQTTPSLRLRQIRHGLIDLSDTIFTILIAPGLSGLLINSEGFVH